jgi:hypothetical protein
MKKLLITALLCLFFTLLYLHKTQTNLPTLESIRQGAFQTLLYFWHLSFSVQRIFGYTISGKKPVGHWIL